jgi:aryl-alcohol dehydrogenase-like predicted oxidoreductase
MKYRTLGRTGLEVSEIGFGTSAIGGQSWGVQDDRESMAALERAFELGVNFFDTALTYGYGHAERLLAEFIRREKIRDKIIISTKVPPMNFNWPARADVPMDEVYPAHHIENHTVESLRNLRIQQIDILHLHVWAEHFTEEDEWWQTMERLKEEGAIRFVGVSVNQFEPNSVLRLIEKGRIDVVQVHYNIFEQAPEDKLFAAAKEANVGIIARGPLEESALTGKLEASTRFPEGDHRAIYFAANRLEEVVSRVERLRPTLEEIAGTMTAGALRFCLSRPEVGTVIPGIRSVDQAEENLATSEAGPLSEEALAKLREHRWDRAGAW